MTTSEPAVRRASGVSEHSRYWAILALVVCVVGVPLALGLVGFLEDTPIREGEPSPRTVFAPERIQIEDMEATERQRRQAADAVAPVLVQDNEARAEIVLRVDDVFATVERARRLTDDGLIPGINAQIETLTEQLPELSPQAVRSLVELSDDELARTREAAVEVASFFADMELTEDDLPGLDIERKVATSAVPASVRPVIVGIIEDAVRPTTSIDASATQAAREQAAADVDTVQTTFARGVPIVRAGEVVTPVQLAALRAVGLDGADAELELLRAALLVSILTFCVAVYIRRYREQIWQDGRELLLLSVLMLLFAALVSLATVIDVGGNQRYYMIPVGAIVMLATILFDARIGVLVTVPAVALVAYALPDVAGIVPFIGVAGLISIPLVSRVSSRGELRQAAWKSTIAYIVLAAAFSGIYSGTEGVVVALVAGLANGLLGAVIVNGLLPFLESTFGTLTTTGLLDYADRNHPLLRELESKAPGSYQHSIMVSTLTQRACRAIGADAHLGEVMALYHDIGKVAKPHFFIENQYGVANPHDALDNPRQSAIIIQRHVTDGVEMAKVHRLPHEISEGIRTHHGTTLVAYFYRKAVSAAVEAGSDAPDEGTYRHKGGKPQSREQAVLMLADCCEGATRAAALHDRNLSSDKIAEVVKGLLADRVADGQLDESPLTFHDLRVVERTLIETLCNVYHPRIEYPDDPHRKAREVAEEARRELDAEEGEAAAGERAEPVASASSPEGGRRIPALEALDAVVDLTGRRRT